MIDASAEKRVLVRDGGEGGPYIMAQVDQLPEIRRILDANRVRYWVDEIAVSLNGQPAITVVNLRRGTDAAEVQKMLDDNT